MKALPSPGFKLSPTRGFWLALAGAAAMFGSSAASAATATSTLSVTGTVGNNCTVSTTAIAHGVYNSISGAVDDATGALSITCSNGTAWAASAGVGAGTGASYTNRKLTSGANLLNYNLYTTSGYATVWGDGTLGTATLTGTGTGALQSVTVYSRIPVQSTAAIGSYTDTVNITITY